jgi:type VI secretion system protein ImpE
MNAKEHFEAADLSAAIAAAREEVRKHPADTARRGFLCELLCFAADWERADRQLDALGEQEAEAQLGIAMFRQVLRAAQARQQFFDEGRLPEFVDPACERLNCHMEASIHLREGRPEEAATLLDKAEQLRPKPSGTCNDEPFADFRDLDDLTSSYFEVLTSNGKYYWIPMERVELIEFRAPQRPRDLLWRRAHMIVKDGPDGEVFMPVLYAGSHDDEDQRVRLGRYTDWQGEESEPSCGRGQRMFLVGDRTLSIMELTQLQLSDPVGAPDRGEDTV